MDAAGIIPARAGFTPIHPESRCTTSDHPRSRGVYCGSNPSTSVTEGSSPLARGLQQGVGVTTGHARIIPARAGFTAPGWGRHLFPCGSSPLARGLRLHLLPALVLARIIPARAGFTTACRCAGSARTDHPRSRGVYFTAVRDNIVNAGSSPLARGLPQPVHQVPDEPRIIPARAGFTAPEALGAVHGADHPRSRGVYELRAADGLADGGSSPLARGLHQVEPGMDPARRIIPARAGFTSGLINAGRPD